MNIQNAALASIGFPLTGLAQTLSAVNYSVNFETVKFTFEGPAKISMEQLKQLYPEHNVAGKIIPITFVDAQRIVNRCLSFHVKGSIPQITPDTELSMARFLTFWHLIKEEVVLPSNTVFLHIPDAGSYFNFGIVWNFCIILLSGQEGILISGQAYD